MPRFSRYTWLATSLTLWSGNHCLTLSGVCVCLHSWFLIKHFTDTILVFYVGERDPVIFNSQHWKHELPPEFTVDYAGKYPIPPMDVINTMTAHLSSLLVRFHSFTGLNHAYTKQIHKQGLTLFGYDVITDVSTGKQAVIDVNYFPGATW